MAPTVTSPTDPPCGRDRGCTATGVTGSVEHAGDVLFQAVEGEMAVRVDQIHSGGTSMLECIFVVAELGLASFWEDDSDDVKAAGTVLGFGGVDVLASDEA